MTITGTIYVPFEAGWAIRPKTGDLHGKNYIEKYCNEVKDMFKEVFQEKPHGRGPSRMREEFIRRHPGAFDLLEKSEIRSEISRIMLPTRNEQIISIGGRRGRKSDIPSI